MVDGTFGYPARILSLSEIRALLPETVKPEDSFIFPAEISNDNLDSYYTRMHESSLANYAADAMAGVALQNSHRHDELPFGRSLYGLYDAQKTYAEFYTVRGLNLNGIKTDDLIRGIEAGIIRKVSIGFHDGTFKAQGEFQVKYRFLLEATVLIGALFGSVALTDLSADTTGFDDIRVLDAVVAGDMTVSGPAAFADDVLVVGDALLRNPTYNSYPITLTAGMTVIIGRVAKALETSMEYLVGMTEESGRFGIQGFGRRQSLTERSDMIAMRLDALPASHLGSSIAMKATSIRQAILLDIVLDRGPDLSG